MIRPPNIHASATSCGGGTRKSSLIPTLSLGVTVRGPERVAGDEREVAERVRGVHPDEDDVGGRRERGAGHRVELRRGPWIPAHRVGIVVLLCQYRSGAVLHARPGLKRVARTGRRSVTAPPPGVETPGSTYKVRRNGGLSRVLHQAEEGAKAVPEGDFVLWNPGF